MAMRKSRTGESGLGCVNMTRPLKTGVCVKCGKPFIAQYSNKEYCSNICRRGLSPMSSRRIITCETCGIEFPWKAKRRFCSKECHKKSTVGQLSSGTIGAISELIICVDLMKRGLAVFRAQSPSCPCDLVVIINGSPMGVEVTKGTRAADGTEKGVPHDPSKYDILALVFPDGSIIYQPPLPGDL